MAKKLFVPERYANARKTDAPIPDPIKKGFKEDDSLNSKDPS